MLCAPAKKQSARQQRSKARVPGLAFTSIPFHIDTIMVSLGKQRNKRQEARGRQEETRLGGD